MFWKFELELGLGCTILVFFTEKRKRASYLPRISRKVTLC